jgi:fluoride exporter
MGQSWLAVGFGGALGSMARHGVNMLVARRLGQPGPPYATFVVNVVGCGVIGLLAGLVASERVVMTPTVRLFLFVGILGGFTTFSSFGLDTFTLVREGRLVAAILNTLGQVVIGLAALALGYYAALRS